MSGVAVSAIASALFAASELSPAARRLGADLLGSAAGCCGVVTEGIEDLAGRVSVSWNRARVLLGELSRAGFITYWSYEAAGRRWVCVSWLAWVVGVPRVVPAAEAAGDFAQDAVDLTQNVLGDELQPAEGDRSAEIAADPVVVVVLNKQTNTSKDLEQTTTARTYACEGAGAAGSGDLELTQNVLGDGDRIVALLTDPEIGLGRGMARRCASGGDFWRVVGNVFEWRRQRDAGSLRSPHAALSHRLLNDWDGVILEADRYSDLWRRHCWPALAAEDAAELTQNVLGDELQPAELQPAAEEGAQGAAELTQNVLGDELQPAEAAAAWAQAVREYQIEAGGTFGRWAASIALVSHDAGSNTFTLAVGAAWFDWVSSRLSKSIRRKLTVLTGRPAAVSFVVAGDSLGVAA